MASFNPFEGTSGALNILTEALINPDHVSIIVFSLLLGGMEGVMSRSGGTHGIVNALEKFATTRKRGQLFSWFSALFIFFDVYANTLIRGNAYRPMTDLLNISRDKLAYVIASTAAPLAFNTVITTCIGFEITQISNSLNAHAEETSVLTLAAQLLTGAENAYIIFL